MSKYPTIQSFAYAQLAKHKPKQPGVGLAYTSILKAVLKKFPDAKTTIACLRWYNTQLRSNRVPGFKSTDMPLTRDRSRHI